MMHILKLIALPLRGTSKHHVLLYSSALYQSQPAVSSLP